MAAFGWIVLAASFLILMMVANNSWPWVWAKITGGIPQPGQGNAIVPNPPPGQNPFNPSMGPGTIGDVPLGNSGSGLGQQAANEALSQVGKSYKWGAAVNISLQQFAYDCSSLVASIFGNLGTTLPRTSEQQAQSVTPVSSPQIGDLVFGSFKSLNDHVGIYVGNNQVVSAWDEAHGVISGAANWPGLHYGRVNG